MNRMGMKSTWRIHQLAALLLVLSVTPALTGFSWEWHSGRPYQSNDRIGPVFEAVSSNVTASVGQTVYLPCRVKHLGDKTVSWIRKRDLHILSSAIHTYTSDPRFEVLHQPNSDEWTLRIMSARKNDEGLYECQVNTDPKINHAVSLVISDSNMRDSPYSSIKFPPDDGFTGTMEARILGPKEQYVKKGSTISFTCLVTGHPKPPKTIYWYHGPLLVTFNSARGGISLDTEKTGSETTSKLILSTVSAADTGNYTCVPANARLATVALIVVDGEHTEAMQRDAGYTSSGSKMSSLHCQLLVSLWIFVAMAIT